ncbi:unnamed protein product [Rotaria sp. Silwood2]|nr:unnamed protein product [Rotaria sp. Silwood2]CAF4695786.1 unnamed protein product [Rotaria sp. Silwood2]
MTHEDIRVNTQLTPSVDVYAGIHATQTTNFNFTKDPVISHQQVQRGIQAGLQKQLSENSNVGLSASLTQTPYSVEKRQPCSSVMASNELSSKETLVRIDIDGEKYRLAAVNSSTVAELRTILSKRYKLSSSTRFLDAEGCILFPEDEKLVTISALLTENHFVRLTSDKSKTTPLPIPEMSSKAFERKTDPAYAQSLSHLSKAPLLELTIPSSTLASSPNEVTVDTDLDLNT